MRDFTIEIDGEDYRGHTASAKAQYEAMHIAGRTGLIATLKHDMSDMGAVAPMFTAEFKDIDALFGLLVKDNVKRAKDDAPVAPNLFADDMQNYYLLLARVLRENLAGFWKLRRPEEKQSGTAEQ